MLSLRSRPIAWSVLGLLLAGTDACSGNAGHRSTVAGGGTAATPATTDGGVGGASDSNHDLPGGGSLSLGELTGVAGDFSDPSAPQLISQLRIEPADALLTTNLGASVTQSFHAFATMVGSKKELEITDRTAFYVPDNFLVGGFPLDGGPVFSSRLPATSADPPQRGGLLTVQAQAAGSDGSIATATTSLRVQLLGSSTPTPPALQASPALPDHPESQFVGSPTEAQAPELVYPNSGTLLPPNLGNLEVHFRRGNPSNTLFQIQFKSESAELSFYTRCASDPVAFDPGACSFGLDPTTYGNIAESNQGTGPVKLVVRGSNEQGAFGESKTFELEFAENRVDGAVYYWDASPPRRIMRVELTAGAEPEAFLTPGDFMTDAGQANQTCVGCHILSRDGSKMAASIGNSSYGRLGYIKDLAVPRSSSWLTVNPASEAGPAKDNRILTGSFNPDGSQWVAAAPKNDPADDGTLFFHNGDTGLREGQLTLPFTAAGPDWSPDGQKIAMTHIYGSNATSIEFQKGGIDYIERDGNAWSAAKTLVSAVDGKNRYNATFLPGSKYVLYSESTGSGSTADGYADPSAKTWVVEAKENAKPIYLENVGTRRIADLAETGTRGIQDDLLMDTFPRATPFETKHRGGTLMWFTVSSQRRAGLRKFFANQGSNGQPTQQLIWMFALDPAALDQGLDGSRPGFFLPFQDLQHSNHMAQWTERLVSDQPHPPTPTPTPPKPPKPPAIK